MRLKIIFGLAVIGILAGIASAYLFGLQQKTQPPAFTPASNPYAKGIYANGLIESVQGSGENIALYPEVSGTVLTLPVPEGSTVTAGTTLLQLDDRVQRAATDQLGAQADAADAQAALARATLANVQDQFAKQQASHALDPRSVSRDAFDSARHGVEVAQASLEAAQQQARAAHKAFEAARVLLSKYALAAPADGTVLAVNAAAGGYASPAGVYDGTTGAMVPPVVVGNAQQTLAVRCYVDEILIARIPDPAHLQARMFIRGTELNIPLEYVRRQHYVSPKIELSNQRTERVDVRVLPLVFTFRKPEGASLYPGQLVDVYIGEK